GLLLCSLSQQVVLSLPVSVSPLLRVSPSSSGGLRFSERRVSSIETCRFQVTRAPMGYFYSLVAEFPILSVLHLALVVWMLVDAHRRGVDYYWYYIVLFIPLAGPIAYFLVFKAQEIHGWRNLFQPKTSLHE